MTNLWSLNANEISNRFLSNEISSDEIINSLEERYKKINPIINAISKETFKSARLAGEKLSKMKNLSFDEFSEITSNNFFNLFGKLN